MKTTNFEISKRLAEIGFRAECSYFYFHSDNNDCEANSLEKYGFDKISECDIEDKYYPAYDLETLLDALPEINKQLPLLCFDGIGYLDPVNIGLSRNKNESLADTAGRMIILLHEKNLIKF